jgi:hypothetical protein
MSQYGIGIRGPTEPRPARLPPPRPGPAADGAPTPVAWKELQDRVEISRESLAAAARASEQARVREIRAQIAAGTYLTEEKLDVVVRRLGDLLGREGRSNRVPA